MKCSRHLWTDGATGKATCLRCGEGVSDDDIRSLREEAAAVGDSAQVELCERALLGDADATEVCARVIADAQAQEKLYWHCECGKSEPAQPEYEHGDSEPCCLCDDGVARVVTLKEVDQWEQSKALGNVWRPPRLRRPVP